MGVTVAMLACVAGLLHMPVPAELPTVLWSDKYGLPVADAVDAKGRTRFGVIANSIYLPGGPILMTRMADEEDLVHEVAHYVQYTSGMDMTDRGTLEPQAYSVQREYNEECLGEG